MSNNNEQNGVRFVWNIENFSCGTEGMLQSPSFSSHSVDWEVRIYPGHPPENITLQLQQLNLIRETILNCSLALLDSEGSPLIWKERQNFGADSGSKFSQHLINISFDISSDDVFVSRKAKFLANDTLRVQCLIWKTDEGFDQLSSVFARTLIEPQVKVIEKKFIWSVPNITSFSTMSQILEREVLLTRSAEWLKIRLSKTATSFRAKISVSLVGTRVNCVVFLRDASGKSIQFAEGEYHYRNKKDEWTFEIPISRTMLKYYGNQFLPNDTLSLVFECTVKFKISFSRLVEENDIFVDNPQPNIATPLIPAINLYSSQPESKQLNSQSSRTKEVDNTIFQALMDILEEGFMSDFSFRVQDKTFPVHKNILSARSSVFRAMFTADMKEKESSSVDIPDVDADTFRRMLNFIYSDSVEDDMQWDSASKLYSVADKYALELLKQKCSQQLKSGMCVSSVLDVLLLGDTHQDDDLKDAALDYFARNDKEIVPSEYWSRFTVEHPLLALGAFQKLYEKKLNF